MSHRPGNCCRMRHGRSSLGGPFRARSRMPTANFPPEQMARGMHYHWVEFSNRLGRGKSRARWKAHHDCVDHRRNPSPGSCHRGGSENDTCFSASPVRAPPGASRRSRARGRLFLGGAAVTRSSCRRVEPGCEDMRRARSLWRKNGAPDSGQTKSPAPRKNLGKVWKPSSGRRLARQVRFTVVFGIIDGPGSYR